MATSSSALKPLGVTLFSSFGCMAIGVYVYRSGMLPEAARKGVAALYARLVFPTMVFVGVADIDLHTVDRSLMLTMLTSKAVLAAIVVAYSASALRSTHGSNSLAHAVRRKKSPPSATAHGCSPRGRAR